MSLPLMKNYINGEWVDSKSNKIYEDVNPANGEVIAEFPSATDDEIEAAIQFWQNQSSEAEISLQEALRLGLGAGEDQLPSTSVG